MNLHTEAHHYALRKALLGDSTYAPSCLKDWHGASHILSNSITRFAEDSSMTKAAMQRLAPDKHSDRILVRRNYQKVPRIQAAAERRRTKLIKEIAEYSHYNDLEASVLKSERLLIHIHDAAVKIQRVFRGYSARKTTEIVRVYTANP